MVGGRFVMTDRVSRVSQAETDNKLYKLDQTREFEMFQQVLQF